MKNINREKIRELVLEGVEDALDRIENQYEDIFFNIRKYIKKLSGVFN